MKSNNIYTLPYFHCSAKYWTQVRNQWLSRLVNKQTIAAHFSNIIACYVHYADTRGVAEIRGKVQ